MFSVEMPSTDKAAKQIFYIPETFLLIFHFIWASLSVNKLNKLISLIPIKLQTLLVLTRFVGRSGGKAPGELVVGQRK